VFNRDLYFCRGTAVYKAWTGTSDNGANIEFYGKSSFNYFGSPSQQKRFTMFRPVLAVNDNLTFNSALDVDFRDDSVIGAATYNITNPNLWDVAKWDSAIWAAGSEIVRKWSSPAVDVGYCAAGKIRIATNSLSVKWLSTDFIMERGKGLI